MFFLVLTVQELIGFAQRRAAPALAPR
jgi:hypothetical protein